MTKGSLGRHTFLALRETGAAAACGSLKHIHSYWSSRKADVGWLWSDQRSLSVSDAALCNHGDWGGVLIVVLSKMLVLQLS